MSENGRERMGTDKNGSAFADATVDKGTERFTPGPWHVRMYKHHTNRKSFVVRRTHQVVNQSELRVICTVASGCNADGNLDLIAAAPKMYALLEQLQGALGNVPILKAEIEKVLKEARGEE